MEQAWGKEATRESTARIEGVAKSDRSCDVLLGLLTLNKASINRPNHQLYILCSTLLSAIYIVFVFVTCAPHRVKGDWHMVSGVGAGGRGGSSMWRPNARRTR
jgi:hypothetical protein